MALATGLNAGSAAALTFNFSFSGFGMPTDPATVTGTISGLLDNQSNQTTGLTVTITSATNGPVGTTFTSVPLGSGFTVSNGSLVSANAFFVIGLAHQLSLYNSNGDYSSNSFGPGYYYNDYTQQNDIIFTPASVPGPLPLFGAAAAFNCSRRLRRRVKSQA